MQILKQKIKELENNVSSTKGKISLLEQQYVEALSNLEEQINLQEINDKAIELLNFVQQETRDKIKETFENIIIKALQYVFQDDGYGFMLDFDRRGHLPKLSFYLKKPDMQEPHNILHCTAGGERDVVALALRFVLLEISGNKGFLFLDEIEKRIYDDEIERKLIDFIKEIQQTSKRQIFIISHRNSFIESLPNTIDISRKINNESKTIVKEEKSKKKRGRPRKVK